MHGAMEAVAVVAEVVEGTLVAVEDILAVDTLADTAATLAAGGTRRVVIIILAVLVTTVVAIMVTARAFMVAIYPAITTGTGIPIMDG